MEYDLNDEVIHVKNGEVEYIKFKRLEKYKNIVCIFTLKPLDYGLNTASLDEVKENYKKVLSNLDILDMKVVRPCQTHTNNVAILKDEEGICTKSLDNIDGIITDKKNKLLSLTFADCTPIALIDPNKNVIGNIHSGWRGTLNAIVKVGIKKMVEEFKSNNNDIICIIGPTIRNCHFEVEEDVRNLFYEKYKDLPNINQIISDSYIKDGVKKYTIDTVSLNKTFMQEMGIKKENIIDSNICTVCQNQICHSYRCEKDLSKRATLIMSIK